MHTEAEALTKRCCGPEGCGDVKRPSLHDGRYCIGSQCMAWRWHAWRCGAGCGTARSGKIEDGYLEPCNPPQSPQYYDHIGGCGLAMLRGGQR